MSDTATCSLLFAGVVAGVPFDQRWAVTVEELAMLCGLSRAGVYKLISDGQIPFVQVDARRLVLVAEARQWLEARAVRPKNVDVEADAAAQPNAM